MTNTRYPGDCIECGKPLVSYEGYSRHGWLNLNIGWFRYARVHTLCRGKFQGRPIKDQIEMSKKQMGVYE